MSVGELETVALQGEFQHQGVEGELGHTSSTGRIDRSALSTASHGHQQLPVAGHPCTQARLSTEVGAHYMQLI
jgi:hypothetical protein